MSYFVLVVLRRFEPEELFVTFTGYKKSKAVPLHAMEALGEEEV
jgi:hypothetical protein